MAGETRRQRRDARRAEGEAARPVSRPAADGPLEAAPAAVPTGQRTRGGFVGESVAELRKVEWPNRAQVIQGTIVVILACAVVGAFLWGVDQAFRPFVRDVLIG